MTARQLRQRGDMSHIGKKPIDIPEKVEVNIRGQKVSVTGPKGELHREVRPEIKVERIDNTLAFSIQEDNKQAKASWGTERALAKNMIDGVLDGFEKKLRLEGIGYRAKMEDEKLVLELGFSHSVEIVPPENINVVVKGKIITISGINKEKVNQLAAKIRSIRKPNPYTGKGVRYDDEEVRLKPGKKAIGSGA